MAVGCCKNGSKLLLSPTCPITSLPPFLGCPAGFDSAGLAGAGGAPGEQAASSDVATPPSASWITARREIGRCPDDPMTPLRSPACPTHPGRGDLAAPHLAASHNAVCCAGRPPRRSRRSTPEPLSGGVDPARVQRQPER